MKQIEIRTFDSHHVRQGCYQERRFWVARDVAVALGYEDSGKGLVKRLTNHWAEEFIRGADYDVFSGEQVFGQGAQNAPRTITVLYESGVHLVCIKTHKPAGVRLRRVFATEWAPRIVRGESFFPESSPAPAIDAKTQALIDREKRLAIKAEAESRKVELAWAKAKQDALANLRSDLAKPNTTTRYQVLSVKSAECLFSPQELAEHLPSQHEKWYSPTEMADAFGVTKQRIGLLITELGIREDPRYCRAVANVSQSTHRDVTSYVYNDAGKDLISTAVVQWKGKAN